jgi:hypothetical protein
MSEVLLLLIIAIIAFIYSVNSLVVKFPSDHIELADIDRNFSDCEQRLEKSRDKCEYSYIKAVNETKLRLDINTESFQKAVCYESWQMKDCIAKAVQDIPQCRSEAAKRYLMISVDRVIKKESLGKCSEYGENPPIYDFALKPATNLFFSIILSLIMIFFR